MSESEEEKRLKKLKKDAKDKVEWERKYEDKPPKGRVHKDDDVLDDDQF